MWSSVKKFPRVLSVNVQLLDCIVSKLHLQFYLVVLDLFLPTHPNLFITNSWDLK